MAWVSEEFREWQFLSCHYLELDSSSREILIGWTSRRRNSRNHWNRLCVAYPLGQTFLGNKRNKYWVWTVVNHQKKGIILWTIGDCEASRRHRSHKTFAFLWSIIKCWHNFRYVTDGWKIYPMYIESEDHLVSKTYMTRVEGENTRLRHYLARLHRKTLCYSKFLVFLRYSIRLLLYYLRFDTVSSFV